MNNLIKQATLEEKQRQCKKIEKDYLLKKEALKLQHGSDLLDLSKKYNQDILDLF